MISVVKIVCCFGVFNGRLWKFVFIFSGLRILNWSLFWVIIIFVGCGFV